MGLEELRWRRNSSLKDMMNSYNSLVDEMEHMSADIEAISNAAAEQHREIAERFHELNDMVLTVNYKTDAMKQTIEDKIDDILRTVSRYHPAG